MKLPFKTADSCTATVSLVLIPQLVQAPCNPHNNTGANKGCGAVCASAILNDAKNVKTIKI